MSVKEAAKQFTQEVRGRIGELEAEIGKLRNAIQAVDAMNGAARGVESGVPIKDQIMARLHAGQKRLSDIARSMGHTGPQVSWAFRQLVKEKKIRRVGRGLYAPR